MIPTDAMPTAESFMALYDKVESFACDMFLALPDRDVGNHGPATRGLFVEGMCCAALDLHFGKVPMDSERHDFQEARRAFTTLWRQYVKEGTAQRLRLKRAAVVFGMGYFGGLEVIRRGSLSTGRLVMEETTNDRTEKAR